MKIMLRQMASCIYTHPQYGSNATPVLPDYLHANGANGIVGSVDLAAAVGYEASPETTFLIKSNKQEQIGMTRSLLQLHYTVFLWVPTEEMKEDAII